MNYYPHHIGDYLKDTAHLTMIEDGAYRRLIDLYYLHEQPLPVEKRQVYRLARASTPAERKAIDTILDEYFSPGEEGWMHRRCEEELNRSRGKTEGGDTKRENEKERQRRHRQRRADLFEALRGHGVTPAWDTPTAELQDELSRVESNARHAPVTPPVTRDATAIHKPITNNQKPIGGNPSSSSPETRDGRESDPPPSQGDYLPNPTPYGLLAKLLRSKGIDVAPGRPDFREWVEKGLTEDEALAAVEAARQAKPAPEPIPWTYLAKVLTTMRTGADSVPDKPKQGAAPKQDQDRWWMSNGGIDRKGRELGLFARGGEDYPAFKDRIFETLRQRGAQEQTA
ncbi:hypothetical protein AXY46_03115 [Achromobacter xylosoxidans]|nr:hypothetical protein AXY46_03115 [Achromobacter xylosoxidans]